MITLISSQGDFCATASERINDMDPSWCAIHTCAMEQHSNARGTWWSHYLGTDAHGQRRYCKGE